MIELLADGRVMLPTNFGAMDWAIVVAYLVLSVAVGVYANRYISRLSDFLVAGRALRVSLGVATMTGTEIGLVTLMYAAGDGYTYGLASFHVGVIWGVAMAFVGLTGFIVYRLRATGVMTIPEYYGLRFSVRVRWVGGFILAAAGILNMGLFLRAGADFITGVTGLHSEAWLQVIMTALMVLVLLYTMLGGMVSVVITDFVQFVVLGSGIVLVTILLVANIGWDTIFQAAAAAPPPASVDPLAAKGYGLTYVISMILLAVSAAALWQSGTLRALSARDPRTAKRVFAWSSIPFLARFVIPAFWGVCAFAFLHRPENADLLARFATGPDAAAGHLNPIQAMPVMIGLLVPPVLLGLVVAAMVAAFMSTHDSYLLCFASVLTQDVVAPLVPGRLGDRARIRLTRLFIMLIGLFLLVWGLWYPAPESLWSYMATTGSVYLSGASAVIVCGLYWRRASSAGALAALVAGLIALAPIFEHWLPAAAETQSRLATAVDAIVHQADVTRVAAFAASWLAMVVFSLLLPDRPGREDDAGDLAAETKP